LPVPVTLVNQQLIGPSLGQKSIDDSLRAGFVGFALVAIFMILYYRLPGLLAVAALCVYSVLALAGFKLMSVTLTLSGLAGFILSIGMAVDANVLIFERIKEELKSGKPLASSIDEGFKRAWPSIRDSNTSSLITCAVLYAFYTGTIRGFAVTLSLGIVISMFSAITVTRIFLKIVESRWMESHLWLFGVAKKSE
jgi:preprotein translocase subunit SecD